MKNGKYLTNPMDAIVRLTFAVTGRVSEPHARTRFRTYLW